MIQDRLAAHAVQTSGPETHWFNQELSQLKTALDEGGVMAALAALNHRVAHRFTAVYRFQGDMQRAVFIYDKQGQPSPRLNAIPIADSLSRFVTPTKPFCVTDATTHALLRTYKYQQIIGSYYGVSLSQTEDKAVGSLCHFDFEAQARPSAEECYFLNCARRMLLTRLNGFH